MLEDLVGETLRAVVVAADGARQDDIDKVARKNESRHPADIVDRDSDGALAFLDNRRERRSLVGSADCQLRARNAAKAPKMSAIKSIVTLAVLRIRMASSSQQKLEKDFVLRPEHQNYRYVTGSLFDLRHATILPNNLLTYVS
jgi:hypothetical protein